MKNSRFSDLDAKAYRYAYLIAGFIRGTLTDHEHTELDNWVNENDQNMQLFEEFTDEKNLSINLRWLDEKLQNAPPIEHGHSQQLLLPTLRRRFSRRSVLWSMGLLIAVSVSSLYFFQRQKNISEGPVSTIRLDNSSGQGNVRLTFFNGKTISFPEKTSETFAAGEGIVFRKDSNNCWSYAIENSADNLGQLTLDVPSGKQFSIQLPDGSKIWLNAATTFKFPAVFSNNGRNVWLSGEAYMEVSKNKQNPFSVATKKSVIHVLGTAFNVNTYENGSENIALFKGSIDLSHRSQHLLLDPGTAAHVSDTGIAKYKTADPEEVLGWKEGRFVFKNASINRIMLEISRWYNVEVLFRQENDQLFNANISRNEPLHRVLNLLELNGNVKFKLSDKTIEVF